MNLNALAVCRERHAPPCVNVGKIRNIARQFHASLPLPARFPPIPIGDILDNITVFRGGSRMEFRLREGDLGGLDGAIYPLEVDGRVVFYFLIDESYPPVRKTWTVTHELSHMLLGHPFSRKQHRWHMNREADKLTREILIPRDLIRKTFQPADLRPLQFEALAAGHAVSQQAMKYALEEYGLLGPASAHCPWFPESLECLRPAWQQRCTDRESPPGFCVDATADDEHDLVFSCRPFVADTPAFWLFGLSAKEKSHGLERPAREPTTSSTCPGEANSARPGRI